MTRTDTGSVETFDDQRGYGIIRRERDGAAIFFHCTALADGTRSITAGQAVRFASEAGHRGRYEARAIEKVGSGS